MIKLNLPLTLALTLGLLLQSCTKPAESEQTLTVMGSSTIAPLALTMGERFEAENPDFRVDVQTGGSSRGVADTQRGLTDIGMVSRALKPEEQEGMEVFTVGFDGIAIVTHADNPIQNITSQQIVDIYLGKIDNWQGLGGEDAPISVVHKSEAHSTSELFLKHFDIDNTQVEADTIVGDNQQGIKTIVGNPNAIGYLSIGAVEHEIDRGTKIKLLALDGIEASRETVADGRFPLQRPLNLTTKGTPSELAQKFIDFSLAEENHDIIDQQKFIPPKN